MEDQCTSFSWEFCTQEDGMEELRHSLLYTTLELETTVISAKEEILRRECEIFNLRDLLGRAVKEKGEVEAKCKKLMLENLMLQQQQKLLQKQLKQNQEADVTPQSDCESKGSDSSKIFASYDSDENTIQSSQTEPVLQETLSPELPPAVWKIACEKPLPEKGKLLQAVIEAGPLLQNLLLAGPLPHWQHPPPLVDSIDIPPVVISPPPSQLPNQNSCIDIRKRSNSLLSDVSHHSHKYQKLVQ